MLVVLTARLVHGARSGILCLAVVGAIPLRAAVAATSAAALLSGANVAAGRHQMQASALSQTGALK
eukprot:4213215-Alexandrium_andersonii.AAC.1